MKAVVAAFNQEKALVGAFSVITNLRMQLFEALMEACYARCNCWTDFPDMGGQITHEVDAWCFQEACWCSYDQVLVSGVVTQYIPVSAGRLPLRHPEDGPVLLHQGRHHL